MTTNKYNKFDYFDNFDKINHNWSNLEMKSLLIWLDSSFKDYSGNEY